MNDAARVAMKKVAVSNVIHSAITLIAMFTLGLLSQSESQVLFAVNFIVIIAVIANQLWINVGAVSILR